MPTSAARPCPSRASSFLPAVGGYTLLELTVVVVILSIAAFLIPLGLETTLEGERLSAATSAVAAACRFARSEAITSGSEVGLVYDLDADRFWVEAADVGAQARSGAARERLLARSMPRRVGIAAVVTEGGRRGHRSGRVRLSFSPRGRVAGHLVQLDGPRGEKITLEVTPLLGMVRVHDGWSGYARIRKAY